MSFSEVSSVFFFFFELRDILHRFGQRKGNSYGFLVSINLTPSSLGLGEIEK
jgi:hypothetical protein